MGFKYRTAALLCAAALVATACSSSNSGGTPSANSSSATSNTPRSSAAGVTNQTLRIGTLLPLSGESASFGKDVLPSEQEAAALAKSVLGINVEITTYDDQAETGSAVTGMHSLIAKGVPAVIGAYSNVMSAVAPIANNEKVLALNPGASDPSLAKLGTYVINVNPLVADQTREIVKYAASQLGKKRFAILYDNNSLGKAIADVMSTAVKNAGAKMVLSQQVPAGQSNFSADVPSLRDAKPDAVYIGAATGAEAEILGLMSAVREAGLQDAQFISTTLGADQHVLANKISAGMVYATEDIDYTYNNKLTQEFVENYKQNNKGQQPTPYNTNYANSVLVLAQAAADLSKQGKKVDGANLLNVMQSATFEAIGAPLTLSPLQPGETSASFKIGGAIFKALGPGKSPQLITRY